MRESERARARERQRETERETQSERKKDLLRGGRDREKSQGRGGLWGKVREEARLPGGGGGKGQQEASCTSPPLTIIALSDADRQHRE